jgi:hypothetical protein
LADQAPDFGLVARMAAMGFEGALLDVGEKSGKRLLDALAPPEIAAFAALWALVLPRRFPSAARCPTPSLGRARRPRLSQRPLGPRTAWLPPGRRQDCVLIRDLIPRDTAGLVSAGGGTAPTDAFDLIFLRDFLTSAANGPMALR